MTTTDQLAAIEARAQAATEGPWEVMNVNDPGEGVNFIDVFAETDGLEMICRMPNPSDYSTREGLEADAEFIAHARTDVPYLLAMVRERDARFAKVAELAEEWRYKGEFGWGAWHEGHGPDPEGYFMDKAAGELRAAITATEGA